MMDATEIQAVLGAHAILRNVPTQRMQHGEVRHYVLCTCLREFDDEIAQRAHVAAEIAAGGGSGVAARIDGLTEAARHLVQYSPLEIRAPDAPYHIIAYRVNADAFETLVRLLREEPGT